MKKLFLGTAMLLLALALVSVAQDSPYRALIDEICGDCCIYKDADLATVFDSTYVDVEETGLSHVTRHTLTKVLTWSGAKQMTAIRLDYDPASNFFEAKEIKVHRKCGKVENVDVSNPYDHPQPQHMIYWGTRMKVYELPRLNPGDAVEVKTYMKGFLIAYLEEELFADEGDERYIPPMRGHYYDNIYFQENNPLREKVYQIRLLDSMPGQFKVYNSGIFSAVEFDGDTHTVYSFWAKKQPAYKHEPRQPDHSDFVPKVVFATVKDWPEKSRWFFQVNNEILMPDEAVTAKAQEIVKGLKTKDEQIDAILHWTAQNIRYSGITMGKGEGYTLHSGMMTLNDRCGVCKDIAGMSISLLRGAGFTVFPAMTMAGARVEDVPADQFNHCVVAIKQDDGSYRMIDPTWAPYAMATWSHAEANQNYVIGSPEGEQRMEIQYWPAEDNQTLIDLKGSIDKEGTLTGTITIKGSGYGDTRIRRGIAYRPAEYRDAQFADWISNFADNFEITTVTTTDIDDLDKPYVLTLKFKAPEYAIVAGDQMLFKPVLSNFIKAHPRTFDFVYEYSGHDERTNPMHVWNTRNCILTEAIKLPSGFKIANAPDAQDQGGDWAGCQTEVGQKGNTLTTKIDYRVNQRTIPAKYYDQVKGAYDTVMDFSNNIWLVKKGS